MNAFADRAFTLVELLIVLAVIVVILTLAGPAFNALKGAGDVNKAVYDIAGIIQQAGAYAKASNTYVYLGIEETDVNQSSNTAPQMSGEGKIGRVAMALIASRDGTRGYQLSDLSGGINANAFQADMAPVGNVQVFENLHLLSNPPSDGNMTRPVLKPDPNSGFTYNLADANCLSVTPFAYPLGAAASTARYYFRKVIQFDPQGVVRIRTSTNADTVTPRMEIGLQQTHGTVAPGASGNVAAIQIDGVTGAVQIFRP